MMFHHLSKKVMTKAFKKAEDIVRKSSGACQSDEAWNENNKHQFDRCTEELKSSQWIHEMYNDIEKISAQEGNLNPLNHTVSKAWMKSVPS